MVFDSSVAVLCPGPKFTTVPAAPMVSAKAKRATVERAGGRKKLRPDLELSDDAVLTRFDKADTQVSNEAYVPVLHGPEGT